MNLNAFSIKQSPWQTALGNLLPSAHGHHGGSNIVAIGSIVFCLLLAACSDDDKTAGGTEEDAGIVAIEDKTVSGVSQKGPFVNGSTVKLYEMDGETLAPTGKSFPGKIASDDGRFTVPSISLASQYALLEANGYFRNEITGGKSNGTITLNALTDLSDREKVNINLLTHLEYERAFYLVGTGVKVSDAKRQAESEILKAFGIEGNFENSEDMDIFSSGDGNAALLAFSVLMLGNLTEADLTERLTNFATDIEQDGKWDDETAKTVIADWASDASLEGGLANIRKNIAGWKFSNDIPVFEKYVDNFWWQNYGLGTCDKDHQGEVKPNSNTSSVKKGVHFICDDNTWRVATDTEKDTYKWIDPTAKNTAKDGDLKKGDITDNMYKYDASLKEWRSVSGLDTTLKQICTMAHEGTKFTDEESGDQYLCTAYGWACVTKWCWETPKEYYWNTEITYEYMTDLRDSKKYRIVTIGKGANAQIWMAENLNYDLQGQSWCYDNKEKNCDVTGRYYTWNAAMEACPQGWHLPEKNEWITLYKNVGGGDLNTTEDSQRVADILKSRKGWSHDGYNGVGPYNGSDAIGFTALPGGMYYVDANNENFGKSGIEAGFWTATDAGGKNGPMAAHISEFGVGTSIGNYAQWGYNVRCVKDKE